MQRTCFFGSPVFQLSRWLMIASRQTVVLPVCRSPMISWRWPRPIAVIASMALMPVSSGSRTSWRCTTDGRLQLEGAALVGLDVALAVDRLAERVDHAAEVAVADRHREDVAGALDLLALLDLRRVTEDDHTDVADVEVQRDTQRAALELEQLVGHGARQALDTRDAVAGLRHDADLFARGLGRVRRDVVLDRTADFVCRDRQLCHQSSSVCTCSGLSVVVRCQVCVSSRTRRGCR